MQRDQHRGWDIAHNVHCPIPDEQWVATSPDYDASYEGPEDGWVIGGQVAYASTRAGLIEEIDNMMEDATDA